MTEMIGEGKYPESICEELLGYCLAPVCQMGGLGGDNMSIIIICLLHGKPWEQLVERCKKIHADKKAATKLSEPAFAQFDRFTADGPFAEVSVLKASDDGHNTGDTSSSSHTSSPSSSPISTDEKFEAMLMGIAEKTQESVEQPAKTQESAAKEEAPKVEIQVTAAEPSEASTENDVDEASKKSKDDAAPEPSKDTIVSNGE